MPLTGFLNSPLVHIIGRLWTLHVKGDTMQFVEHYVGECLGNIGGGKNLLSETPVAQIIIEKLVNLIR